MTKILFLIFLFVFSFLSAGAQKYVDGYVVTLQGDTLHGKLELFNRYRACRAVELIIDDSLLVSYSPLTLKSYYRDEELMKVKLPVGCPPQ